MKRRIFRQAFFVWIDRVSPMIFNRLSFLLFFSLLFSINNFSFAQSEACKNQWKNDEKLDDCVCSPPPNSDVLGLLDYGPDVDPNCFMFPDLIVSGWTGPFSEEDSDGVGMEIYQLGEQTNPSIDPTPRIRIRGALANIGEGPFILGATSINQTNASATQRIFAKKTDGFGDFSTISQHEIFLEFAGHAQHNHFHIPDFLNITLRNSNDAIVSTAKKVSYCVVNSTVCNSEYCGENLADFDNFDLGDGLNFDEDCSLISGSGLMAITPGNLDIYNKEYDGNSLSVAGVCPGFYKLVMIVDEGNKLIESNKENNTTEILAVEIKKKETFYINNETTVTKKVTWKNRRLKYYEDGPIQIDGTIVIDDDKDLIIDNCEVQFSDDAKIIVEKGTLVIKGSTLTNMPAFEYIAPDGSPCINKGVWRGIEVRNAGDLTIIDSNITGTESTQQNDNGQVAKSIIKNAHVAVTLGERDANGSLTTENHFGEIIADNVTFENNQVAIEIAPTTSTSFLASSLKNCSFIVNEFLPMIDNNLPEEVYFLKTNAYPDLMIDECSFESEIPSPLNIEVIGIHSENTIYTLTGTPTSPTTFQNLDIGISARGLNNSSSSIAIEHTHFTNDNPEFTSARSITQLRIENFENTSTLDIQNCIFEGYPDNVLHDKLVTGIESMNAAYTVHNGCGFTNLWTGIHAFDDKDNGPNILIGNDELNTDLFASNPPEAFNVFQNNFMGVLVDGADNVTVEQNQFTMGANSAIGIYNDRANYGYDFDRNRFTASGTTQSTYGIVLNSTGPDVASETFSNTFNGVTYGFIANGNNSQATVKCNEHLQEHLDIVVLESTAENGGMGNIEEDGIIASPQGSDESETSPASNKFSSACPNLFTHIRTIGNTQSFEYWHHSNQVYVPTCDDGAIYDPMPTSFQFNPICFPSDVPDENEPECDPADGQFGIICIDNVTEIISDNIDILEEGNHPNLYAAVQNHPTNPQTHSDLQDKSPYLSDGILKAIAQQDLLGVQEQTAFLIAHVPLTPGVWQEVNASNLPNSSLQAIQQAESNTAISERHKLESRIAYLQHKKELQKQYIVQHYLKAQDLDQAIQAVLYEADEADYKAVIPLYLRKGDIANAQQYLNLISAHNAENTQYIALQNLHIGLQSAGRSWYDITAQEEATIRSIASSPTRVAVHAQAILHWIFGEQFETHIPDVDGSGSHKRTTLPPLSNRVSKQELHILPNPSKGMANIYWTPEEGTLAELKIFDLTGRQIVSHAVDVSVGQTQLSVEGLKNGIYICTLNIGEQITYQTKWVIVN